MIELSATVQKKTSKGGKEYYVIEIPITHNYTKRVFLEPCEVALIDIMMKGE